MKLLMQNSQLSKVALGSPLMRFAGVLLVGALCACGGGGHSGAATGQPDAGVKPAPAPESDNTIKPVPLGGYSYVTALFGASDSGSVSGSMDASANMTLMRAARENPDLNYNFTFPSGMPGGVVKSNDLFSLTLGGANKEINILTPSHTQSVQNVFWRDRANQTIAGFAQAGFPTDIHKVTWPESGTATYTGKAFQYLVEHKIKMPATIEAMMPNDVRYTLYTSDVIAKVDYATKTLKITITPSAHLVNHSGVIPNIKNSQFASYLTYNGISYASRGTRQATMSGLKGNLTVDSINFFGPGAEELGGFLRFDGIGLDVPTSTKLVHFVSFTLRKN